MGASRLVDRDPAPVNTILGQTDSRDPFGQRLDQVDGVPLDSGLHGERESSVVDGVGEVVGGGGARRVETEHQVDDEGLTLSALVLEDAVMPPALQAGEGQLVARARLRGRGPCSGSFEGVEHPQRVAAGAYVVDPDPPHPRPGQHHGQCRRRVLPLVDRSLGAVGGREQPAEEGLATRPDEQRLSPVLRSRPGVAAAPSCAPRPWRTPDRGRARPGLAPPRRPGSPRRRAASSSRTAATTPPGSSYVAIVGHPVAVRAPVHGDVAHTGRRDDAQDVRVGQPAGDVIDDGGARRRPPPLRPPRAWCRR